MKNQLRAKENLHVVFWLIKDFAWLMHFRWLGMAMVLPTISLGFWITWKTYRQAVAGTSGVSSAHDLTDVALKSAKESEGESRKEVWSDFYHNLAISSWIMGNGVWMTGEFFFDDGIREWAMPFFFAGLFVVAYFYLVVGRRMRDKN